MPQTAKRKTASSRSRSAGYKKKTARSGSKTVSQKRPSQRQRARRNQNWAFFLLFVSLLSLLSMFGVHAPFIDFIKGMTGLIGAGFFILPFCLMLAGILLIQSRGGRIFGRVFCSLITPLVIGGLLHAFVGSPDFAFSTAGVKSMYESGNLLHGGGVLCGYITAILITYISRAATIILFLILSALTILNAFDITIASAFDALKDFIKRFSHRYNDDDEEYYEEEDEVEHLPAVKMPKKRRPVIDVPLDGEVIDKTPKFEESKMLDTPKLHLEPPSVKTPAQVLEQEESVPQDVFHVNENNFTLQDTEAVETTEPGKENTSKTSGNNESKFEGFTVPRQEELQQKTLYSYPPISLLKSPKKNPKLESPEMLRMHAQKLVDSMKSFGIDAHIINIVRGPSVTRYEIQLDPGIKLSRLTALSDDIALALGATGVFIAPIPDKSLIGIEVPNKTIQVVNLQEVIASDEFTSNESNVAFAMGKDISGNCIVSDIAKLPHLLIAGTTGSGKSVCMNSLIISLLYKSTPEQVRLIMIDPKMVELGIYNGIPHLLVPVVTDPRKASGALQWAVLEMMKRYKMFAERSVRDMQSYNRAVSRSGEGEPLPQIVIVIDELADLMVVARKEVEDSIMRLTQMARAAGMHLIIATQRPSVDVITGVIKSNIPSRIAFAVASKIESNIILGSMGAEKLIGRGDMLYAPIGTTKPTRVQGCFISGDEVEAVVNHVKQSGNTDYSEEIIEQIERHAEKSESNAANEGEESEADEMLDAAIDVVVETGQASVSMLQRRLKLGYSRAARIVDQMEERGIVGAFEGAKPRQLLITKEQWQEIKMRRGI